ncbi:hypothetical protein FQR65_LT08120 [Abscondita terminalis]|nr:hypothetical protein FQR65_LT08120 [Abscondita terminalis]
MYVCYSNVFENDYDEATTKLFRPVPSCVGGVLTDGQYNHTEMKHLPKSFLDNQENDEQNLWELSGKFEGDMVFIPGQRNGLTNTQFRWPNATVPYEIDQRAFGITARNYIENAIGIIRSATCVKPRRRLSTDLDYVYITNSQPGCFSHIGKIGGKQNLNLGLGCVTRGIIIHEFLHSLGFLHQQSDSSRDSYVTILYENIQLGAVRNFDKFSPLVATSFGEPYDYSSIMHYSRKAFTANGQDTIVPLDPRAQIGQRLGLSPIDIKKIKKMYNCPL